jgi:hypothetical protein
MVLTSGTTGASCTAATGFQQGFSQFISACASDPDKANRTNIINPSEIRDIITHEQAIQEDLLTSLRGIRDLKNLGGANTVGQTESAATITAQIAEIDKQIKDIDNQTEVQNQVFLQSITSAPKKTSRLANLNDISLGIFFGSIFIFIVVITVIQGTKINGSLKMALYTLIGGIVMTIVIYALVKEVA